MTKITRITTQKKRKNRFNIFLDEGQGEKYGFSVDEAVLIEHKLRKDLDLDDTTIATLIQKDTLHKSYTLAINFLSYRMRTKKEIYDYLVKKEVDEEHITKIMDKLLDEGLIDDKQFADSFVRTRIQTASKGPMLVKKELMDKGVSKLIASEAVDLFTYEEQHVKATKWVEKKLNTSKSNSFKQQVQQLQSTLMQKGFTQDVIKDVLADVQEEKNDDAEWDAIVKQGEKLLRKHQQKFEGYELRNKMKEALYRKGFTFDLIDTFLEASLDE
ncbi:regulatory protein [Virgibacillus subterraneus]|uniref:Regulatory protein RecX n=1 Tax=Virgibacillus subterraneus TaxID=621109 RepID=A0A1H9L195_9BACI|nr:recombination regulator RecX [Virgibacillus subterraneus]SER05160.1 regulatory protein [Virgibacillus subterraneus]